MWLKYWSESLKGRSKLRWKNNTTMKHKERGLEGMDWIYLAQDGHRRRNLTFGFYKMLEMF
jgi:hypothetical protein